MLSATECEAKSKATGILEGAKDFGPRHCRGHHSEDSTQTKTIPLMLFSCCLRGCSVPGQTWHPEESFRLLILLKGRYKIITFTVPRHLTNHPLFSRPSQVVGLSPSIIPLRRSSFSRWKCRPSAAKMFILQRGSQDSWP